VFTMDTGDAREIWLMPAQGGKPFAVLTGGIHTHPAMQPNDQGCTGALDSLQIGAWDQNDFCVVHL
jgi:hypothetical protein